MLELHRPSRMQLQPQGLSHVSHPFGDLEGNEEEQGPAKGVWEIVPELGALCCLRAAGLVKGAGTELPSWMYFPPKGRKQERNTSKLPEKYFLFLRPFVFVGRGALFYFCGNTLLEKCRTKYSICVCTSAGARRKVMGTKK